MGTSRFDLAHNEIAKSYDSDNVIVDINNSDDQTLFSMSVSDVTSLSLPLNRW